MDEKVIILKQRDGFGIFMRGILIGAAIGLLFAPRSGREMRDMIGEKSGEVYDKAKDVAQDARDRAQTVVDDARNKINETAKKAKASQGDSKEELKRKLEIMEDVNNPSYPL